MSLTTKWWLQGRNYACCDCRDRFFGFYAIKLDYEFISAKARKPNAATLARF
jgi:hypothetical protein